MPLRLIGWRPLRFAHPLLIYRFTSFPLSRTHLGKTSWTSAPYFVIGTPQTCIERLHELRDAMRIDHFNASFWFGDLQHDQVLRSMRLFHEEVMPAFG